jgi:hypothetical protein
MYFFSVPLSATFCKTSFQKGIRFAKRKLFNKNLIFSRKTLENKTFVLYSNDSKYFLMNFRPSRSFPALFAIAPKARLPFKTANHLKGRSL